MLSDLELVFEVAFQSTPPRRGRPCRLRLLNPKYRFNPRPREGGDSFKGYSTSVLIVSIHAPAKGATTIAADSFPVNTFQSTPPRRGRP